MDMQYWSGEVLLEPLVLFNIIGTFSGPWLLCRVKLSVESTPNDTEDHCYESWPVAEGRVLQIGSTGLEAEEVLLEFTTSTLFFIRKYFIRKLG